MNKNIELRYKVAGSDRGNRRHNEKIRTRARKGGGGGVREGGREMTTLLCGFLAKI